MFRWLAVLVLVSLPASHAFAQTGVSDDRVSIPDGPGSVEGLGDNARVDGNMGLMTYDLPFELPHGFERATPELGLTYSSGSGNGIAGIGWAIRVPSIERLTLRGLPEYDADDEFAADGSEQLVRVSTTATTAVYRARFERSFVRYTWTNVGPSGYWKAEYPNGSVGYFGATASGALVPEARLAGSNGDTFRYHLVESVDVYGHRVRYDYALTDAAPYLVRIGYVHEGTTPRYTVTLAYEARTDTISDAKPGFEDRMTQRLHSVSIAVSSEVIRRYVLVYENDALSGGLSRLARLEKRGRNGTVDPTLFAFSYSGALGASSCGTGGCNRPFLTSMGTIPGASALRTGGATLIDLDGDSLPDLVDTSLVGPHRIYRNHLVSEGHAAFPVEPTLSGSGTHSGFDVAAANVQALDLNGDGFTDLANMTAQTALCNHGTGDWSAVGCSIGAGLGFTLELDPSDVSDANPLRTRFLDVDGDRRIDVLRTDAGDSTIVRRNGEGGFVSFAADAIGLVFDVDRLFFADVNGDGLLDPVHVGDDGTITRRTNLGLGHWGPWTVMAGPSLNTSEVAVTQLEDLNGDGLDDLVIVLFDSVRYALNRGGTHFDPLETIAAAGSEGGIGTRSATTTVLVADMNGSGSADVVWVQTNGLVQYLELFPTPPGLLTRIENGVGAVQEITYGTAIGARASSPSPWVHPLTIPMNVVSELDAWTKLTGGEGGAGRHEITTYRYRDGFYDGNEKQYRGFARVERVEPGDASDDSQEAGRTVQTYDVGAIDPYRNGLLLTQESFGGDGVERALAEDRVSYTDVTLAMVPSTGLLHEVHFWAESARVTILKEGALPSAWATTRTEKTYDGFGRVTRESTLGVVNMGSPEAPTGCAACAGDPSEFGAPCGATCRGDEAYTETAYVAPLTMTGGRWLLGSAHTVKRYGEIGGLSDETRTYYDGPAFVGLPLGELTLGNVSRTTSRRDASSAATVATRRTAFDAHGNVTVSLDPLGSTADDATHRRTHTYDATALRVVRTDLHLQTPEGSPYKLRREYSYDAAFDLVSEATGWMVVEGAITRSARKQTSARYDEFGRRIAIIRPGDTEAAPTIEYTWALTSPVSRIVERRRSARGGALDLERVICIDGRGRAYQERTRIDGDRYQVSGFAEYNGRGTVVRTYQPYVRQGGACDLAPPSGVLHEDVRFDGIAREIHRTFPAAGSGTAAGATSITYAPLVTSSFDEDDLDPASPHANTPTVTHRDGLGRVVGIERTLTAGAGGAVTRASYDGLGRLTHLADAQGNTKSQGFDLLGRVVAIDDPSSGSTTLDYDDAGNLVSRTDARGVVSRLTYDGVNRVTAQWDDADPSGSAVRIRYDFGGSCAASDCTNAEGHAIERSYPIDALVVDRIGGDARAVDAFGFDAREQATFDARTFGGMRFVTRHVYDDAGRLTSTTHPDGRSIVRDYDGVSRTIAIDGVVNAIVYDDRGETTRIERANGAIDAQAFDGRQRLAHRSLTTSVDSVVEDVSYDRDVLGNITRIHDLAPPTDGFAPRDARFAYDAWSRVVSSEFLDVNDSVETQARTYDALDDVRSSTSTAGASSAVHLGELVYDDARPNAVVSAGGVTYEYDEAGNMIRRGEVSLAWDHLGRLTEARRGDVSVARFSYGVGAARATRIEGDAVTLYASEDYEVRDGIGVIYVRSGRTRIARLESAVLAPQLLGDPAPLDATDGEVNAADAWAAHAVETNLVEGESSHTDPGLFLRSAARRLLAEAGDGAVALHTDHLGSLIAATDAAGAERGHRRFRMTSGDDRENGYVDEYGFTGQETIASLGLVRFEHRWLDPVTGRWTQPDPSFELVRELTAERASESADRYAYVRNDFVNLVDHDGQTTWGDLVRHYGGGEPPAGMQNPHGHHILYKTGNGAEQQRLVAIGQAILVKAGIDPIHGPENLCWAPNIAGQHNAANLKEVVDALQAVEKKGGTKADYAKELKRLGAIAAART